MRIIEYTVLQLLPLHCNENDWLFTKNMSTSLFSQIPKIYCTSPKQHWLLSPVFEVTPLRPQTLMETYFCDNMDAAQHLGCQATTDGSYSSSVVGGLVASFYRPIEINRMGKIWRSRRPVHRSTETDPSLWQLPHVCSGAGAHHPAEASARGLSSNRVAGVNSFRKKRRNRLSVSRRRKK